MAATTTPVLALPSGERAKVKNLFAIGALLAGVGVLMAVGGLVAAWVNVGHFAKPWPPEGVQIRNYDGTLLSITMLMSAVTVEWGLWAARRELRSQATAGFVITVGLGLAFVNLLWFFGRDLGFGPGESSFAVLLFAIIGLMGVAVFVGTFAVLAVTLRVLGRQVSGTEVEMARAVGWFWQFLVLSWIVAYATVWLFT
jgi:heme/copper-type cytochrome/quinol oxidase subunit 3